MYSIDIDLSALLQMLQNSRHSGRIYAQIPYGFAGLTGGYVFIDMVQGRAIACYLVNTQKQIILTGAESIDVTSTMGVLHWTIGQAYQQTNMSLPAVHPHTSDAPYTNHHQQAVRPYPVNTQQTNTRLPAVQPYSPRTQHTNPNLPPSRPYTSGTQHTSSNLPSIKPYSSGTQNTNPQLPALRPLMPTNTNRPQYYSFSAFVAERLINIDSNLLTGLHRRLRRVLVLVDGQRSVIKIAVVLHPNEDGQQEVFDSLKQLAQMHIIFIRKE